MDGQFVIVILVVVYLRRAFHTKTAMPFWDKRLQQAMFAAIGCLVLGVVFSSINIIFSLIISAILGLLLYVIDKKEVFKSARFLLSAILPYLIASVANEVLKRIHSDALEGVRKITDLAVTFTALWGIGVWLVTRKQQKELSKARAKAVAEEENNRVVSAMKAQLEVQVAERTAELTRQKEALQLTVDELKATQAQLIQSEKMASLGELTAGIAHEIQNPLNFVSNFSDVNNELIDEMLDEIAGNNMEDVSVIAKNIKDNNSKIIYHGKRADAIVKGMLQHSRKSTGQKEPTDINALCDEYLRLSYHGLRAKDKSFNSDTKTYFDESIGKINIVPQDIGRVLLNLFNNAFYAVSEEKNDTEPLKENEYRPLVSVSTKAVTMPNGNAGVEIRVKDNGKGIPQNVIDKIFQPFFTTKPTGQGTGLGLSISYDIVTKEHGGTIKVQSEANKGTEFIIQLPV